MNTRIELEKAVAELKSAGCCQHGEVGHCGDKCMCVEAMERQLREILHLEGQREREMVVQEVVRETADTTTLVLFSGDPLLDYEAGQFLTIDVHQFAQLDRFTRYLEDQKGEHEKPRAYSLSSAPCEENVAITVKAEPFVAGATPYPPLLSPYLAGGMAPGSRLKIRGFTGAYVLRESEISNLDLVLHLCAGSGIVPSFSVIKESLHRGDDVRHLLLYSSKTRQDVTFYEAFEHLHQRHPDRFEVVHCITRGPTDEVRSHHQGRISLDLLKAMTQGTDKLLAFACGPGITTHDRRLARARGEDPAPRFVEHMTALLSQLGLPRRQIRQETWG